MEDNQRCSNCAYFEREGNQKVGIQMYCTNCNSCYGFDWVNDDDWCLKWLPRTASTKYFIEGYGKVY